MGCLSEDVLSQHAAGALGEAERAAAEAHLLGCSNCQARLQLISSLVLSKTVANLGSGDASRLATQQEVAQNTLASPSPGGPDTLPQRGPVAEKGARFGRYVLLEQLGTGGMGEVYTAYDPQLDRKVALKLLRPGGLSRDEGKARLLREAQAMARLAHPNVVAVHDVGEFDERVYVAMEFVDGETLSQWLRAHRDWHEVLGLFLAAGAGLAAAHKAGIVHRDFKPDNVLIAADGRARVLDFGLARHDSHSPDRAPTSELPEVSLEGALAARLTRDGAIMGTPGYMAPEQLAGKPTDARSDQFAFCVTLWEALYGRRPWGGATLKAHAQLVSAGKLPDPPGDTPVPAWVHDALARGLCTAPDARWPTMDALLEALQPRKRKTGRWAAAAVGFLGTLAVVATGVAVSGRERTRVCGGMADRLKGIWDPQVKEQLEATFAAAHKPALVETWKATRTALDAYTEAWVKSADETCVRGRVQKTDAEATYEEKSLCLEGLLRQLQAQTRVLAGADPGVLGNALRAARSLDPLTQCTDAIALVTRRRDHTGTHSAEEEALTGKLRDARALYDTGQYVRAADVSTAALKAGGPTWLLADGWLIAARAQQRAAQYEAARASLFEATLNATQAGTADALARAWARQAALIAQNGADYEEARRQLKLARANAQRAGLGAELEAELENTEGQLVLAEGNFADATGHFRRALGLQESALGEHHPETAMTLNNLGVALSRQGKFDEALVAYERALQVQRETSGPEHPNTASTMQNLTVILTRSQRYSEALNYAERALTIREAALGPDHPEVATSLQSLSKLYRKMGSPEKSLEALQRALVIREKENAEGAAVAQVHDDLGHFFFERRDFKEAVAQTQRAVDIFDKVLGPDNPRSAGTHELLGVALSKLGQWDKARAQLDAALSMRRNRLGESHVDVASSLNALGDLAFDQGHFEQAKAQYEAAFAVRHKALGPNRPELATDLQGVGRALLALKKPQEAVAVLQQAVDLREKGDESWDLAMARFDLARAVWEQGAEHHPQALELCAEALPALDGAAKAEIEKWVLAHPP